MKIARVYLKQKNKRLDQSYSYIVSEDLKAGQRVIAPFGKGNRKLEGFIAAITPDTGFYENLKEIEEVLDEEPVLNEAQLKLLNYINQKNFKSFYDNLSYFTSLKKLKKTRLNNSITKQYHLKEKKNVRGTIQKSIIDILDEGDLTYKELKLKEPRVSPKTLDRLIELGILEESIIDEKNTDFENFTFFIEENKKRNPQKFYKRVFDYKELYNEVNSLISFSGQTLILFPDNFSANTFKNLNNFEQDVLLYNTNQKFNKDEIYKKIKNSSFRVIIGSNAALFLPYSNLEKVIVVKPGDEGYNASREIPYNSLEVAEKLAEFNQADFYAIDLADSTISAMKTADKEWDLIESNPEHLDLNIINTTEIVFDAPPVDEEIISPELEASIRESLDNNEKSLLFINRKGYYNNHFCQNCGEPIYCPRCHSVLQSRKAGKEVVCRVCGFESSFPDECPNCAHKTFVNRSFGIEKTLEEVKHKFPEAKIDPYFYGHTPNLKDTDIIVATKSIFYYKNLENVSTVGALLADLDTNYPDFHAAESAVRLYYELFSKYNNARKFLQLKNIKEDVIEAIGGNSLDFYLKQLDSRAALKLPPFNDLYIFTLTADNSKTATKEVRLLQDRIKTRMNKSGVEVLPYYNIREKKGTSQRRFVVKAPKNSGFYNFIDSLYKDGEIEALASNVSIVINPSNIV